MKRFFLFLFAFLAFVLPGSAKSFDALSYVRPMMGTGSSGRIVPMAAAPFGKVHLAPDTYVYGSGYHQNHSSLFGFSHTHKSGGGGTDFQDILFLPITDEALLNCTAFPKDRPTHYFSHEDEYAEPGYYRVALPDVGIVTELTATERCGVHRYSFRENSRKGLLIDLKSGCEHSTTIWPDEDFDTVKVAMLERVDDYTVRGYRISNGWAPEQHVYFYARFSHPIASMRFLQGGALVEDAERIEGTDVRAILNFGSEGGNQVTAWVGISPVSTDGARANLNAEVKKKKFDAVRKQAQDKWNRELSVIRINDEATSLKEEFYTSLYFSLLYPMLYSDVTNEYRSSDSKVYRGDFRYFAGVLGLWDTFRAQNPLISILRPDVTEDLMHTFQAHFDHCGQLPIWTLAGVENMCMIGYHSMPVIADAYYKAIRGCDAEALFRAMKTSANRDTFGYFLKGFRGARHYTKYGYVPCDVETTSVSKTLEYCYDDWCIAQMARMLGHDEDYRHYSERATWYKNVFDASTRFMRGRTADGGWRTPFDPFMSNHYRENDDFCEGTAWQWTFFVPHDGKGLINLMGGRDRFISKLDSLFIVSSKLTGPNPAPDITGMTGQYAHGNEPGHHTLYMYNYAGQPWKGQRRIRDILYNFYDTTPEGLCGNDDTGQMSAWFVFSAMGFYPVTHGQGVYFIGSPAFADVSLRHTNGTLRIRARGASKQNCYIRSVTLNGTPYHKNWLSHEDLFRSDAELVFEMGDQPNTAWGSSEESLPPSLSDEMR